MAKSTKVQSTKVRNLLCWIIKIMESEKNSSLVNLLCLYCIKGCNQKQEIMDTEVVKVLKSWKSSLDHYEKLDDWKLSANLSVLGAYLRTKDENAIMGVGSTDPMIRIIVDTKWLVGSFGNGNAVDDISFTI